jgi:hypothetical protein
MRPCAIFQHRNELENAMAANLDGKIVDHGVVVVPLPPAVIEKFGCRPGTSIRLHRVDGVLRVVPDAITPADKSQTPNAVALWESCSRWWRERGSNASSTVRTNT